MLDNKNLKQSNNIDFNKAFLAITFFMMTVELSSSIFNLLTKKYNSLMKYERIVTWFFFIIYMLLNTAMILQTVLAIKNIKEEKIKEEKKALHLTAKYVENFTTLIGMLLWAVISITSIIMLANNNNKFASLNLYLCILAPLLGTISACFRVYDEYQKQNIEKQELNCDNMLVNNKNKILLSLCAISLLFEFVHFLCHVREAMVLGGNSQNIYQYDEIPVISTQIAIAALFILVFCAEKLIEHYYSKNIDKYTRFENEEVASSLIDSHSYEKLSRTPTKANNI